MVSMLISNGEVSGSLSQAGDTPVTLLEKWVLSGAEEEMAVRSNADHYFF